MTDRGDDQRIRRWRVFAAGCDRSHEADGNRNDRRHAVRFEFAGRPVCDDDRAGVRAQLQRARIERDAERSALRADAATRGSDSDPRLVAVRAERGWGILRWQRDHLRDADTKEYSPDELSWIYYDATRPLLNEIGPGKSVTGTLVFDVPAGVKLTELRVKDSPLSSGSTIRLR